MNKQFSLTFTALSLSLFAIGCSQEQVGVSAQSLGNAYNKSQRDSSIKNYQRKIADTERCQEFKDRFEATGIRYESAANAAFHLDMGKVWEAAKLAKCQYFP